MKETQTFSYGLVRICLDPKPKNVKHWFAMTWISGFRIRDLYKTLWMTSSTQLSSFYLLRHKSLVIFSMKMLHHIGERYYHISNRKTWYPFACTSLGPLFDHLIFLGSILLTEADTGLSRRINSYCLDSRTPTQNWSPTLLKQAHADGAADSEFKGRLSMYLKFQGRVCVWGRLQSKEILFTDFPKKQTT